MNCSAGAGGYTCPADGDCNIECRNTNCQSSTITCPIHGNCYIECVDGTPNGCQALTINATHQNGNFELHCEDLITTGNGADAKCSEIDVQGSQLSSGQTGTSFLVTCGLHQNTCLDGIITCAQGMDCEVDCHGKDKQPTVNNGRRGCRDVQIYGPTDYNLRVECDDNNACQQLVVYAEDSAKLDMTCNDLKGCCDTTVYCPLSAMQDGTCAWQGMTYSVFCLAVAYLSAITNSQAR